MNGWPLAAIALTLTDARAVEVPPTRCDDPGPDAPVTLAAPLTERTFQGFDVLYTMPEDPVGVVFYFTGTTDLQQELMGDEQVATLWNLLVSEGFGVVATERTAQGGRAEWDYYSNWNNNQDAQRLDALRDELIATTALLESTPVVLTGFSDGGIMANDFADSAISHGWPVVAVTPHSGPYGDAPSVPTLLLYAENDSNNVMQLLPGYRRSLDRAGTPYEIREVAERVVTPEAFLRNDNWDLAKGEELFDDLVAHGLIDGRGRRLVADAQMTSALDDWKRTSTVAGAPKASQRVKVLWAMHRYSSFDAEYECNFLMDALP